MAALCAAGSPATAQTVPPEEAVRQEAPAPPATRFAWPRTPLFVADAGAGIIGEPAQNPVQPGAPSWAAQRRACDGCPRRSVGKAFLDTTIINVFYETANLVRGQVTARITPKTWWDNMEQGWVWDLDDFLVNQIGHPYQGNNYFNAARSNGLSFWESAGITAFGSGTWEYFGETNHASLNDLINTTLGGIALGEMFHRTAWLVRDTHATGGGRLGREIAATAIDPITGVKRFLSKDSSRISDKPVDMIPTRLGGVAAAGALWRGTNTAAFNAAGDGFLELDLLYGDPTTGRSRMPYDAFGVALRFGGGGAFSEAKVRGRLLGQPFRHEHVEMNVVQAYDFQKNDAYQFGAQSFNVTGTYATHAQSRLGFVASGWGGLTALGAVDSIPAGVQPEPEPPPDDSAGQGVSEGPRFYDYGPGFNYGARSVLVLDGRPLVAFLYETHHLKSLDGFRANHFLQQLRLDLLAPLHGPLGIGVSGEYFDRRTYYQDEASDTRKFHYPQFRAYLTWRIN